MQMNKWLTILMATALILFVMGCDNTSGIVSYHYPQIEERGNLLMVDGVGYNKYIITSVRMRQAGSQWKVILNWKEEMALATNDLYTFKGPKADVEEVYNQFVDIMSR